MNNTNSMSEVARALRNLIRLGIVTDVDPIGGSVVSRPGVCKQPG
nr:MAG TPA: baseplate assembly protein [Caudoviricetes sp.]